MYLAYPLMLGLLLVIPLMHWLGKKRRTRFFYSRLGLHRNISSFSWPVTVLYGSLYGGVALLIVAMAQPWMYRSVPQPSIEARDFALVVDISDSMEWGMIDPSLTSEEDLSAKPAILTGRKRQDIVKRIDAAENSIKSFLGLLDGDRVAFLAFSMRAYYGWPLTDDLDVIEYKVGGMNSYIGYGTDFEGKNGPIQAALNHLSDEGQAKHKVIIMVTDGEAGISDQRRTELGSALKAEGIDLYVVAIGYGDWSENPGTADLRSLVDSVDGRSIEATNPQEISAAFAEIDRLERTPVQLDPKLLPTDISYWFILSGFGLLAVFMSIAAFVRTDQ